MTEEAVDHPKHYNTHPSGIECIDIVRHMSFNLGSAIKYIWRVDQKEAPIQDLRKAIWYLEDEIKMRENAHNGFTSKTIADRLLRPGKTQVS